jgi:Ankyrin repeats (3 copies)
MDGEAEFLDALEGLRRGDFSRLEPLFEGKRSQIVEWCAAGLFRDHPTALFEAFTCACFNGKVSVAEFLLAMGADPSAGDGTGLNAFHWAANRGKLEAVRLLIRHKAALETRSMYGGTVLGTGVWAAIHEAKPDHLQIIEELLDAGADVNEAGFPTGDSRVDGLLRRYGAA